MDQNSFEEQFQQCLAMPGAGDTEYFKWKDIGTHPADLRFTALAQFYLQCDSKQRQLIRDHFKGQNDLLWAMTFYVRRVAKLIKSKDDTQWLRLGLAAAAIQDGRADFRDLVMSLTVLRYGAKRVGIDPYPFVEAAIEIAGQPSHDAYQWSGYDVFRNIVTTKERETPEGTADLIRRFGPEDWVAECGGPLNDWPGGIGHKQGFFEKIKNIILNLIKYLNKISLNLN